MNRKAVFAANRQVREGTGPRPRRLDCGETTFRIPEQDFFALRRLFPALASLDGEERFAAWRRFARSPFAEQYRVTRSPRQVHASDKRIIVK